MTKVELALKALVSPDDLSIEEQELYFNRLGESYRTASPTENEFFADLRAKGGAVGMDKSGNIIARKASNSR